VASPRLARNLVAWARDTDTTTALLDGERPGRDRTPFHSGDTVKRCDLDAIDVERGLQIGIERNVDDSGGTMPLLRVLELVGHGVTSGEMALTRTPSQPLSSHGSLNEIASRQGSYTKGCFSLVKIAWRSIFSTLLRCTQSKMSLEIGE